MKNERKIYRTPQADLLVEAGDPLMLSQGGDEDEGMWQLLTSSVNLDQKSKDGEA